MRTPTTGASTSPLSEFRLANTALNRVIVIIRRRPTDNDVPVGFQFADLRTGDRFELGHCEFAQFGILNLPEYSVPCVLFVSLDQQLCRPDALAVLADGEMNVRRTTGVRHRLDGAEVVTAFDVRQKAAVSLEVGIAVFAPRIVTVDVRSVVIDLPDFDERVADRFARGTEDATGEMRNSPAAAVKELLRMIRSLSVSSGSLSG